VPGSESPGPDVTVSGELGAQNMASRFLARKGETRKGRITKQQHSHKRLCKAITYSQEASHLVDRSVQKCENVLVLFAK
jgi:hypothetical protein